MRAHTGLRVQGALLPALCVLCAVLVPCDAERLYFLTVDGLSSILTNGDAREDYNTWSGASASALCGTLARGLGIDEIEGWATVTCGTQFFKVNFLRAPTLPWEPVSFGSTRIGELYGTAINTDTHTAYVASFELTGWNVRGHYLRGCESLTEKDKCTVHGPCFWSTTSDACRPKGSYKYMSVKASEPVGGGLYADEENIIWLSYETHDHDGDMGGYVESKQNGNYVSYPHVHDKFPSENYGKQEIGYMQMINGHLYVPSQEAVPEQTHLYMFDPNGEPEFVVELPQFRGTNIGANRPIRQPSFAVIDDHRVLIVERGAIIATDPSTAGQGEEVVRDTSGSGFGPIFYRELPKKKTAVPTAAPTPAPATAVPTDAPATPEPAATLSPSPATPEPATDQKTDAPGGTMTTDSPPGTTPTTDSPPGTTPTTDSPATAAVVIAPTTSAPLNASAPQGSSGLGTLELILIVGGAALLCLCCGLIGGWLLKSQRSPPAGSQAMLTEEKRSVEESTASPQAAAALHEDSPPSSPESKPQWSPISDRNFSSNTVSSLIQTCELSVVAMRQPAGDVRLPHDGASFSQHASGSGTGAPYFPIFGDTTAGRGHSNHSTQSAHSLQPTSPTPKRRSVALGANTASLASGNYASGNFPFGNELSPTPSHQSVPLSPTGAYGAHAHRQPRERFKSVVDRAAHTSHVKGAPNAQLVLSV